MRQAILFSILVLLPAFASGQCEKKTDEFTGAKGTLCERFDVTVEQQPQTPIWKATGRLFRTSGQTALILEVYADGWNFLTVSKADALIDGHQHTFRVQTVRTAVEGVSVMRQLAILLTRDALSRLSGAVSVRLRLKDAVFRLPARSLSKQVQRTSQ